MGGSWEELLDEAEQAWEAGDHHLALQLCDRVAQGDGDPHYYAALLRGDVLLELGDAAGALSSYESVADPDVEDPMVDCARGLALFELARLAEAENALSSALRGDATLAEAHHTLGLIGELIGNGAENEHFRTARRLDPDRFPPRPQLSREEFEECVETALAELPKTVQEAVHQIPVLVAEIPHPEDLLMAEPPLSPRSLGLFVGMPIAAGSVLDAPPEQQPAILLFKRNLERACEDRQQLVEEIRLTVLHEVGHALGLSEEDLEVRGLD